MSDSTTFVILWVAAWVGAAIGAAIGYWLYWYAIPWLRRKLGKPEW